MILALGLAFAVGADTLHVASLSPGTSIARMADSASWGPPGAALAGGVRVWMLRTGAGVALVAWLPDSTPSSRDCVTVALDTGGDRAPRPQHDDFAWEFHRILDSSVIFRGRDGRWQPPRDDPDWRLGTEREGGGWRVRTSEETGGWLLVLELDSEYLTQAAGGLPGLALSAYDEATRRWVTWPAAQPGTQPAGMTDHPHRWGSVQPGL